MKQYSRALTLDELVDGFLFSLRAEGKSDRTHEYYCKLLKPFLEYTGSKGWNSDHRSLDAHRIREFLSFTSSRVYTHSAGNGASITRKSKPGCAWPYYRALRRLSNWAVEEGYLDHSPLSTIRFKQPSQPPVQGYSGDELKRLLAVCQLDIKTNARFGGIRNRAMLLLFIDSGMRRTEMANAKLSDLNLEKRLLRIMGKGNKIGLVPFSPTTAKALWAWLIERKVRAGSNDLWVTEEGTAFSVEGLMSWFARLKKRAGVDQSGGVHRLRHTAALQYLRGAKDSFLLQLYLRHESLEMSRRYTRGLKAEEAIEAHRHGASPVEGLGLN